MHTILISDKLNGPIGLDTSVVLRLLVGEPAQQARKALLFVRAVANAGQLVLVSDLVVAESYFALQAHYNVPKLEALRMLADFMASGFATGVEDGCALRTLQITLESSTKLGFVDRLIHAQYTGRGARLASFEVASTRLDGAILLKA